MVYRILTRYHNSSSDERLDGTASQPTDDTADNRPVAPPCDVSSPPPEPAQRCDTKRRCWRGERGLPPCEQPEWVNHNMTAAVLNTLMI